MISTGEYQGARRWIEAIYYSSKSLDAPTGYFAAQGGINLNII